MFALTIDLVSKREDPGLAYVPASPARTLQKLVAAQVRVRGTAENPKNLSLRHFIAPEIYVPSARDFIVATP